MIDSSLKISLPLGNDDGFLKTIAIASRIQCWKSKEYRQITFTSKALTSDRRFFFKGSKWCSFLCKTEFSETFVDVKGGKGFCIDMYVNDTR